MGIFFRFIRQSDGRSAHEAPICPNAEGRRAGGGLGVWGRRQRQQCSEGPLPSVFSTSLFPVTFLPFRRSEPRLGHCAASAPGLLAALPALILSRPPLPRAWLSTNSFKEINRINSSEEFHK